MITGMRTQLLGQLRASGFASSTMKMLTGMRTQLLGKLRASRFVRAKGYGCRGIAFMPRFNCLDLPLLSSLRSPGMRPKSFDFKD